MGTPHKAPSALLFAAVTFSGDRHEAEFSLQKLCPGDWNTTEPSDFSRFTAYYEREMGTGLRKIYALHSSPLPMDEGWTWKLKSNAIEEATAENGRRKLNIDPGFLTPFNFTLFTTKGFSHRIFLHKGIWSELTLEYRQGHFQPLPWTYPDYREESIINFLSEYRKK